MVISNGRPLKPSLKSASSSSIVYDMRSLTSPHARARSIPSTPAYGLKKVHFKGTDDSLKSVRLFRRSGKPISVSKPTLDTDTDTDTDSDSDRTDTDTDSYPYKIGDPDTYPFPFTTKSESASFSEIAECSLVPPPNPSPYANVHFESVKLPPANSQALRGTILVRNIAFEKHVRVRFTLDEWATVSEVTARYSGPVTAMETLAGASHGKTVGDLVGPSAASGWDRFSFAIRLEDYELSLWRRTLFLAICYVAPDVGEFWDNNSNQNYRITFRSPQREEIVTLVISIG